MSTTPCPTCCGTGQLGGGPRLGPEFPGGYGPITRAEDCPDCLGGGDVLCGYCPERRVATTEIDPGCPACEECRRESDADNQL